MDILNHEWLKIDGENRSSVCVAAQTEVCLFWKFDGQVIKVDHLELVQKGGES